MTAQTSCGVVIGDGRVVLLGHATRSPRWDIPKGIAEPGEDFAAAAARELREETGLTVAAAALAPLGVHRYLAGKDLAVFAWWPAVLPVPGELHCDSTFAAADGAVLPEFDRFGLFPWDVALTRVGRTLAQVLTALAPALQHDASGCRPLRAKEPGS